MTLHPAFRAALAALALAACATAGPANLGVLKTELRTYQESGAYDADLTAVAARAQAWVIARAPQVEKPALVLDIDETSLSNYAAMKVNDFGYFAAGPCSTPPTGPCGAHAWENSAQATAIAPVLALYRAARAANVTVFFLTGRREPQRAGTEANLRAAGYTEWGRVILREPGNTSHAAIYKAAERAKIAAEGYTIIANVGDQKSDLDGGYAERAYQLPNPYYFIP